jgi:hypothetical protein
MTPLQKLIVVGKHLSGTATIPASEATTSLGMANEGLSTAPVAVVEVTAAPPTINAPDAAVRNAPRKIARGTITDGTGSNQGREPSFKRRMRSRCSSRRSTRIQGPRTSRQTYIRRTR